MSWGDDARGIGQGLKDAFGGIGDGISKIITTHKGEIPPALQGELEKLKIDFELKSIEMQLEASKMVRDFFLQYEGSADQVPKFIVILRAIIRPIITMTIFISFLFFLGSDIIKGTDWLNTLPKEYWWMFGIVLSFWFGGRAAEHFVEKLNNSE